MASGTQPAHGERTRSKIVLDSEVSEIRLLLQEYAGSLINRSSESVAETVEAFLFANQLNSAQPLIEAIRAHPRECEPLLEVLLAAETGFFRQHGMFEVFKSEVLPAVHARKGEDNLRPLRIWSAGCGTGEEAYSIGMSICEALNNDHGGWNAHIVAGDIRRQALKVGERGLYPAKALLELPGQLLASYFSRVGDHFLVKPRLRNLVTFTWMNLIEPAFIGRFDCIFCLDVLPHLWSSARTALLQRLQLALKPGGYVFLGEKEHFPADASLIRHTAAGCTLYQRPLAAGARAGK